MIRNYFVYQQNKIVAETLRIMHPSIGKIHRKICRQGNELSQHHAAARFRPSSSRRCIPACRPHPLSLLQGRIRLSCFPSQPIKRNAISGELFLDTPTVSYAQSDVKTGKFLLHSQQSFFASDFCSSYRTRPLQRDFCRRQILHRTTGSLSSAGENYCCHQ